MAILLFAFAFSICGQTLQLLHSFQGLDGKLPFGELVEGRDGNLYGTTLQGGVVNQGTVFRITKSGELTRLVSFNAYGNGGNPRGGLVLGIDGNLYGTTQGGGVSNLGTIFRIATNGSLATLASFNGTNGALPGMPLMQSADGNIYGTTQYGGAYDLGTIFKVTTNGLLTKLFSFVGDPSKGGGFASGLVQVADGSFFGTAIGSGLDPEGGMNPYGTVFRFNTNGTFTPLVFFNNTNGASPSELIQARDGNLYGTAGEGGNLALNGGYGYGTIFRVTTNGQLTRLFAFAGTNGAYPSGRLVQGNDGSFYGTTSGDGLADWGTVFRFTTNGTLSTLVSFDYNNGASPISGVVQGSDGNFYGTTGDGGDGLGTVFRIIMPVPLESRQSGNRIILSWPTNATGFHLQRTFDLRPPVTWIDSTDALAVIGNRVEVTNACSEAAQFYRLNTR
jgi:uncharacterized repeat protein (TIGR03803 family)